MSFVAADWSLDRQTGNIRYIGNDHNGAAPSYATNIEFYRAIQNFADDAGYSGNDELDITDSTPASRDTDNIINLINGWNIDDTAAEHLYDGSIVQDGGNIIYDGFKVLAPIGTAVQIIQNGAVLADDWWNYSEGGSHDGSSNVAILADSGKSWTNDEWIGYRVRNVTDGSYAIITDNDATTLTGTLVGGTDNDWDAADVYLIEDGLNSDSANGISHNFMLKVRDGGYDIDGRRLVATTRAWGKVYNEFKINGSTRGLNVVALATSDDLNNATLINTIAGYTTIDNTTEGYIGIDVNNDTSDEFFYSEWNRDSYTINQFYERMKWLTRDRSASTLYGLNGELFRGITHDVVTDGQGVTNFSAVEAIIWGLPLTTVVIAGTGGQFTCDASTLAVGQLVKISGTYGGTGSITGYSDPTTYKISATNGTTTFTLVTSAGAAIVTTAGTPTGLTYMALSGTGQMLAVNDVNAATRMWIQLLTGVAPTNNQTITGQTSGATCLVDTTITERTISVPFIGASTGSSLVGGYGIGVEYADLSSNDKLFDLLANALYQAPNNVTFTVAGLVSGDRVLVTNDDTGIDYNQMTLDGALSGGAVTAVVVNGSIPTDTPATGTIRILRADGQYTRHAYSAFSGSTFTIGATDFGSNNAANGANVFITYIDLATATTEESFTVVYNAPRTLFIRVRNGGGTPIKTFETTGSLGSSGGSTTAIRNSDA